uniref:Uncharacterized protein n=1 Tax=Romanomermis culicivorax TaxID=13658 RepID=A0A915I6E1_ROMCU
MLKNNKTVEKVGLESNCMGIYIVFKIIANQQCLLSTFPKKGSLNPSKPLRHLLTCDEMKKQIIAI